MKKFFLAAAALAVSALCAEDVRPVWELNLNEGDLKAIKSTGTAPAKITLNKAELLTWGEGRTGGKALYFGNKVECKPPVCSVQIERDDKVIDFSKPFTVECWFKADPKLMNNKQYTILGNVSSDFGPGFRILYGWGAVRVFTGDGKKGDSMTYPTSKQKVELGVWQHVALTYDTKSVTLYLNGIKAAEKAMLLPQTRSRAFQIGSYQGYAYGFPGAISDVKIYNQVLDASTILAKVKDL